MGFVQTNKLMEVAVGKVAYGVYIGGSGAISVTSFLIDFVNGSHYVWAVEAI